MAVYLKQFETQAAYEAAQPNLILPNVSLIAETNGVVYNPSSPVPPTPSHDYVEIGGVKWATMNVGANSVTDAGLYFQWGDTQGYTADQVGSGEGQKYFDWADYKWTEDYGQTFTKYNGNDYTVLQSSDDAVTAAWGGSWRMPTSDEMQSLINSTNTAWTADYQGSGVAGMVFTDNTDSSKVLFFPAAGLCFTGIMFHVGSAGSYWSSLLYGSNVQDALHLDFNSYGSLVNNNHRYDGFSVRGVVG